MQQDPPPPLTPPNTPVQQFNTPQQPQAPPKKDGLKGILSTILILVAAPLVALMLTAYVFQSYEVDGPSMETTLENHDRLIVLKLPRTVARLTNHEYMPKRGDIIIFKKSGLQEYGDPQAEKQLIKRVIGLPGDHVVVKDGNVTIYNDAHPDGYNPDTANEWGKVITTSPGAVDLTVQPGQVFVCGDNRTNSLDSRYFGPIPTSDIIGRLVLRVFPVSGIEKF